jgi:PAS domain-containing protein
VRQAKDVELILARQLAGCVAAPICIVDPELNVLFYNEAAEGIMGGRFEETGEIASAVWSSRMEMMDESGRRPVHQALVVKALDGWVRSVELTVVPLVGQADRLLGAVLIFWGRPG